MTEEEARKRLEESPLKNLQEPAPKAGPSTPESNQKEELKSYLYCQD